MKMSGKRLRIYFDIAVLIKGCYGALEFLTGLSFFFLTPDFVHRVVPSLVSGELANDPNDFLASHILNWSQTFNSGTELFVAFFLAAHGLVSLILAVGLLRKIMVAYPLALVLYTCLIIYQIYQIGLHHSLILTGFTLFDFLVVWLVWREWQAQLDPSTVEQ
jgi:uncharacterized membrane protein